jgi:hypothetical protein
MKKAKSPGANDDMLPEYDFSGAVRGKYYERFRKSSNVVILDPDVSEAFPNAASVNEALRSLASIARRSVPVARRASSPSRRDERRAILILWRLRACEPSTSSSSAIRKQEPT